MKKLLSLILLLSFTIKAQDVTIGTQVWTAKNLDVTKYRNGDSITHVEDRDEWVSLTTGAWCYYANNTANGIIYGKLYNWFAVHDSRGLAPKGYHIPTDEEWTILTDYLGGEELAGAEMKSTSGWETNGNNRSGFSGLPGGYRHWSTIFGYIVKHSYWWSSSQAFWPSMCSSNGQAIEGGSISGARIFCSWFRYIDNRSGKIHKFADNQKSGYSVRCIKD